MRGKQVLMVQPVQEQARAGVDTSLSLAKAKSMVDAAMTKARQLGMKVSVAVCDKLGYLIALNRMDDTYSTINYYSIGKAVAAAGTSRPSGEAVGVVDDPPVATAVAQGVPVVHIRGGLPVLRGGEVQGGCGVAGSLTPEQDEECARAGIAALQSRRLDR